jgi:hypothetical protein
MLLRPAPTQPKEAAMKLHLIPETLRGSLGARPWPRDWGRLAIHIEFAILFLLAFLLTVAPLWLLTVTADLANAARDLAMAYRPVMATIGLLLLAVLGAGWWTLVMGRSAPRPRRADTHPTGHGRDATTGVSGV